MRAVTIAGFCAATFQPCHPPHRAAIPRLHRCWKVPVHRRVQNPRLRHPSSRHLRHPRRRHPGQIFTPFTFQILSVPVDSFASRLRVFQQTGICCTTTMDTSFPIQAMATSNCCTRTTRSSPTPSVKTAEPLPLGPTTSASRSLVDMKECPISMQTSSTPPLPTTFHLTAPST